MAQNIYFTMIILLFGLVSGMSGGAIIALALWKIAKKYEIIFKDLKELGDK